MTMRSALLALPLLLLVPSAALAEDIVIVVGKSVTARVPFPIGQGAFRPTAQAQSSPAVSVQSPPPRSMP